MSVHTVQYEGIEIEYELTRKNVKYINLRVNKYGKVVVSAGEQVPFAVIDEFVQSKAFWIITHLAEIEKIRNEISDASLYDGKTVYYLGKPYRLRLERGEQRITVAEDTILLSSPKLYSDVLKAEYLAWLKAQAEKKFAEIMDRIYPLVKEYHIARPEIKIRNMKSIWGSCTTTGRLPEKGRCDFSGGKENHCIPRGRTCIGCGKAEKFRSRAEDYDYSQNQRCAGLYLAGG